MKVHKITGVRTNPRLLALLQMADKKDITSVVMAETCGVEIAHAASKLTNYCRLGYLERAGGIGKQFDPYRYRLTDKGRTRIRELQAAAGDPVARKASGPDFGPLLAFFR